MSRVASLSSVRSPNSAGRDAVTTMRAAPAASVGTLALPNGRVMRIRSASICVSVAVPGAASEKRGVDRPFCSTTTASAVNVPRGAAAVMSSVPVCPTTRSGAAIARTGGAPRPATIQATRAAATRRNASAAMRRSMAHDTARVARAVDASSFDRYNNSFLSASGGIV